MPAYREMSRRSRPGASPSTLLAVVHGEPLPSLRAVSAFVTGCGGSAWAPGARDRPSLPGAANLMSPPGSDSTGIRGLRVSGSAGRAAGVMTRLRKASRDALSMKPPSRARATTGAGSRLALRPTDAYQVDSVAMAGSADRCTWVRLPGLRPRRGCRAGSGPPCRGRAGAAARSPSVAGRPHSALADRPRLLPPHRDARQACPVLPDRPGQANPLRGLEPDPLRRRPPRSLDACACPALIMSAVAPLAMPTVTVPWLYTQMTL